MSFRQFRFRLPWQSLKSSVNPQNESSRRSSQPTDEAETSASTAVSVPYIPRLPARSHEIKPERPPSESVQAPERSEAMPPSKSHKEPKVHSQPSSRSRAKNQNRTASKLPLPSKAIPQSPVASNKSPSVSAKASPSHNTSKPSSPAGNKSPSVSAKASPYHNTSKPSSPAGKASPSHDTSKPSSPAGKAFRSRDTSNPSSPSAIAPRSRIASKPPSPSQTSSKNHLHPKPTSQSRLKADSQPSSPSRSGFSPQASSIPWSPSHENSRQQPSKKTSRVQSPSHLSSKPTAQSTSQHPIESPTAIGDETTTRIVSHPANQSPQARPKSRESPLQTKSKQSPPKQDLQPLESKESIDQPETKEVLTSKNTSRPDSNQNSSETQKEMDKTIENGQEPSPELQAESKEHEETKSDKEDLAKTTNALLNNSSKSKLLTSAEITSPCEAEKNDTQKEETMEDLSSKAFQKLKIKYPDEESPKSFTTLTGDNKGASMHLLPGETKTESSIHIHRKYKIDPDQSPNKSTDIEMNFNQEIAQDSTTEEDPPMELYINMNVQGINNSILSNSSYSENNPGIKLKFVRKATKSEDKRKPLHARKAKYTAKAAEKLTFKRRCLGGLLMESSDSEDDNPEKPRRHGCRYRRNREEK